MFLSAKQTFSKNRSQGKLKIKLRKMSFGIVLWGALYTNDLS